MQLIDKATLKSWLHLDTDNCSDFEEECSGDESIDSSSFIEFGFLAVISIVVLIILLVVLLKVLKKYNL